MVVDVESDGPISAELFDGVLRCVVFDDLLDKNERKTSARRAVPDLPRRYD